MRSCAGKSDSETERRSALLRGNEGVRVWGSSDATGSTIGNMHALAMTTPGSLPLKRPSFDSAFSPSPPLSFSHFLTPFHPCPIPPNT